MTEMLVLLIIQNDLLSWRYKEIQIQEYTQGKKMASIVHIIIQCKKVIQVKMHIT